MEISQQRTKEGTRILKKSDDLERTHRLTDPHRYDDMLELPHHQSAVHPRMSMENRAAQFSPFAALTGYGAVVQEAGRLTEERPDLDETEKRFLNEKLRLIERHLKERPVLTFTYFLPDQKKSGGAWVRETGIVRKLDRYRQRIILFDETGTGDGTEISMENLLEIDGI